MKQATKTEGTEVTEGNESTFNAETEFKTFKDDVTKMVNSINKNLAKEIKKAIGGPTTTTTPEPEETEIDDKNTNISPEIRAALKQVKSLNAKLEEKEKAIAASDAARLETERKSAIRESMTGINWASKASQDLFFKAVNSDVVRNDDGEIVGKSADGELPLKDFIQEMVDANPNFLAPKGLGGTGASPSHGNKGKTGIDLDDIKVGMDRTQLTEILKQASMLVPQQS